MAGTGRWSARKGNEMSMEREKALDMVERGESTLEEVLRVTRSEALDVGDPTGAGLES